ncbi:MAG: hypothetical protein WBC91_12285 [Phototrophicaceae bacterium]
MIETLNLNPPTFPETEHFLTGKIPLGDDTVTLVEILSHDRKTIAAWMDYSETVRREWDDVTKPMFILVDMSAGEFSFGAYANKRAADMMEIQAEIPTYIAWVITKSIMGNLFRATLNAYNLSRRKARFMIVYSREDAYNWLNDAYQRDLSHE